ncbi:hypothetical protein SAMD00019534_115040 [Acytostelium subglobosum LB1]|uniref:hypothetical protein n=1 Tax=Acytostelium subglobosum LB1 TaxID=1410327 RepID=UPI0006450ABD|nr:hypothetical protein SAMD00019534_115040 [Acytostelium subglobosum LB1]GAM28328.1 hypothetical protein SAMD00019534_115040 [Acytostelium subglobosum LB1]|eukprot:XP_012748645.1 hypothetical protein SAMD00019534_115040 [Acytostelium subglobosum LB1]
MSNSTMPYFPKYSIYQQVFKRIYSQINTANQQKSKWEYFVLGMRVYQWLSEHDPAYTSNLQFDKIIEAINEIFDIILSLLEMMKSPPSLLSAVVYYANKFVSRTGIKHNQLFNLLLTSTIVTLKFWSESIQIHNRMLADIFEFPVQDINLMERRFLCGVDYQLSITEQQLETFMSKIDITSSLKASLQLPSYISKSPLLSSSSSSSSTSSSATTNSQPTRLSASNKSGSYCMEPAVTYMGSASQATANC